MGNQQRISSILVSSHSPEQSPALGKGALTDCNFPKILQEKYLMGGGGVLGTREDLLYLNMVWLVLCQTKPTAVVRVHPLVTVSRHSVTAHGGAGDSSTQDCFWWQWLGNKNNPQCKRQIRRQYKCALQENPWEYLSFAYHTQASWWHCSPLNLSIWLAIFFCGFFFFLLLAELVCA